MQSWLLHFLFYIPSCKLHSIFVHGAKELNHTPLTNENFFIFHYSVTTSVLIVLWAFITTFSTSVEHFQTLCWPYIGLSEVPLKELVSVYLGTFMLCLIKWKIFVFLLKKRLAWNRLAWLDIEEMPIVGCFHILYYTFSI
jgi:hypothetical protein